MIATNTDDDVAGHAFGIPLRLDCEGYYRPLWPDEVRKAHRVYFIGPSDDGPVKIGFTTHLATRLQQLQTASPVPLRIIANVVGTRLIEALLHRWFRRWHIRGEWFDMDVDRVYHAIDRLFEEGLIL